MIKGFDGLPIDWTRFGGWSVFVWVLNEGIVVNLFQEAINYFQEVKWIWFLRNSLLEVIKMSFKKLFCNC